MILACWVSVKSRMGTYEVDIESVVVNSVIVNDAVANERSYHLRAAFINYKLNCC